MRVAFIFAMLVCTQAGSAQQGLITPAAATPALGFRLFSTAAIDTHIGLGGIGFNVATPAGRKFNLRAGSDFFGYSTAFQEQGANITAHLRLQSAHASLDWFPFHTGFRVSPLLVFANANRGQATAVIPAGETLTLNGNTYISSLTDPLHGAGSVDFRKVSPGISAGFGNIVPRSRKHFTFPVEAGFYYVGQPGLKVTFTGSACDPNLPASIGCESVTQDTSFQQSLAAFIARNQHNLSYASCFPVVSFGMGYSFHPHR